MSQRNRKLQTLVDEVDSSLAQLTESVAQLSELLRAELEEGKHDEREQ